MKELIGSLAESRAGHDKGRIYVVTGAEGRYLLLADGSIRSAASPKKKNIRHLLILGHRDEELAAALESGAGVTDEQVKRVIKLYKAECRSILEVTDVQE